MHDALEAVYQCLNPLLNYWYPTLRLIAKEKQASGRHKKIYGKVPKTPCQKLLESPDASDGCKADLCRDWADSAQPPSDALWMRRGKGS
jgi:hypothetical protein